LAAKIDMTTISKLKTTESLFRGKIGLRHQQLKGTKNLFHTLALARNVVSNMGRRGLVASLTRYGLNMLNNAKLLPSDNAKFNFFSEVLMSKSTQKTRPPFIVV
jgi:hypothetical protein